MYSFKAAGTVTGEAGSILSFRKVLDDHPLVQESKIEVNF